MASIRKQTLIDAPAQDVWDALRDWSVPHERLVPGFLVDAHLDGDDRIVTFSDGTVARELLVVCHDEDRRLVWAVVDEPFTHYNASAQVFTEDGDRSRLVWIADFLPHDLKRRIDQRMEAGIAVIKQTLESRAGD